MKGHINVPVDVVQVINCYEDLIFETHGFLLSRVCLGYAAAAGLLCAIKLYDLGSEVEVFVFILLSWELCVALELSGRAIVSTKDRQS